VELLFTFLSAIVCLVISYQDFRTRLISIVLFPLLFIFIGALSFFNQDFQFILTNALYSILFVGTLLTLIYFNNKYILRNDLSLLKAFALGDVLMLLVSTILFEVTNFVLFTLISSLMSVLVYLIILLIKRQKMTKIPFAGITSLILAFVLFLELFEVLDVYTSWTSQILNHLVS
jgi:hypothetical protein